MKVKLWHLFLIFIALLALALLLVFKSPFRSKAPEASPSPITARSKMPTLKKPPARVVKFQNTMVEPETEASAEEKKMLESRLRHCSTISYDENDRELERRRDQGCDGVFEECSLMDYTEAGEKIQYIDIGCDDVVEQCYIIREDEHGNQLRFVADQDCDGSEDKLICTAYTYDAAGRTTSILTDNDCDGREDYAVCTSFTDDAAGRQISKRTDFNCDGNFESCDSFEYDASGLKSRLKLDSNCDGEIENCVSREFDAEGRITSYAWDGNCDGELSSCVSYAYSKSGEQTLLMFDNDGNGKPDNCVYNIYDNNDFLLETREDPGCRNLAEWQKDGK